MSEDNRKQPPSTPHRGWRSIPRIFGIYGGKQPTSALSFVTAGNIGQGSNKPDADPTILTSSAVHSAFLDSQSSVSRSRSASSFVRNMSTDRDVGSSNPVLPGMFPPSNEDCRREAMDEDVPMDDASSKKNDIKKDQTAAPANTSAASSPDAIMSDPAVISTDNDRDMPAQGKDFSGSRVSLTEPMDIDQPDGSTMPNTSSLSIGGGLPAGAAHDPTTHASAAVTLDLVNAIKDMYRILDLVSEQGSGGLVDKIIIAQDSFGRFVNDISPGAYASMIKVDFAALDKVLVNPLGIYGSRSEIVRFLHDIGAIDDQVANMLHNCRDDASSNDGKTLRSGLYLLRAVTQSTVYVIYWPEDTTWNDDAISSVQRNRVTFMRYLTKIADQIIALISPEHGNAIIWNVDHAQTSPRDPDDEEMDRLFTFQVAKTNEQEENVTIRPGFTLELPKFDPVELPEDSRIDASTFAPRLVAGETVTGTMIAKYLASSHDTRPLREECTAHRLEQLLSKDSYRLSEKVSDAVLEILLKHRLGKTRAIEAVATLVKCRQDIEVRQSEFLQRKEIEMREELSAKNKALIRALRSAIVDSVVKQFSTLDHEALSGLPEEDNAVEPDLLMHIFILHPTGADKLREACEHRSLTKINLKQFTSLKERLLMIEAKLHEHPELSEIEQKELLTATMKEPTPGDRNHNQGWSTIVGGGLKAVASAVGLTNSHGPPSAFSPPHAQIAHYPNRKSGLANVDDSQFLERIPSIVDKYPLLTELARQAVEIAQKILAENINKRVHDAARAIEDVQLTGFRTQLHRESSVQVQNGMRETRTSFLKAVMDAFVNNPDHVIVIEDVQVIKPSQWRGHESYRLCGYHEILTQPTLEYTVNAFELTESDKQMMQMDTTFVPAPRVHINSSFSFSLPIGHQIIHLQLLQDERCLLVTDQGSGDVKVFLERSGDINHAITMNHQKKTLRREKIGHEFLMAVDETKRMLALCATEKSSLHVFIYDEKYTSLQGLGSSVDLRVWYDNQSKLIDVAFLCGTSEELVLVDDGGRARIYSLTTQQFRPASLQLHKIPFAIHSSPDGSCLFSTERDDDGAYLRAYHWSSFGSTGGICLELPDFPLDSCTMTSIGNRSKVYYIGLDVTAHRCKSFVLDITRKSTEFTFKEKGGKASQNRSAHGTAHNCLVDSHAEVWTRFPVVPAVRRRTVKSSAGRVQRSLSFVSHLSPTLFQNHFAELIVAFERATRKPTEDELSSIGIDGSTYNSFMKRSDLTISRFKAGEWLVDILCLIPIHIAVTRDNRFIPLKDGVWSSQLERSLLGATVDQIVDSLSFGWYESIFQSYMASKPVRVVSSMGEQSVGKSFALNHLVDTSFAGSAMRTTEGVWMSVNPTDDALIVALDFEGVHSIERSAQEDSLLVLFNTAMSNLVLFRNNFALSRDIAGLFQSFQSSSTVLDPAANPSLFKSTLVIIIKDVVDSDKNEITKEFRLKFQNIVEVEQDSNFITRLHGGNLAIIPWPVIESRQFYTLFPAVKRMLDKQTVTHHKAGVFLQTMKTLMAKLKVNDWGALDQNLASHRAQQLLTLLPRALAFGATELEPEVEPLKDFDSGIPIDKPDTASRFFLPECDLCSNSGGQAGDICLINLLTFWEFYTRRSETPDSEWVQRLGNHLHQLTTYRIEHVQEWLECNMTRFKADSTQFDTIRWTFESLVVGLRANVQLCSMQCSNCQLLCLQVRHHEGTHNCRTSHRCAHYCNYMDEHGGVEEPCGLPAGHSGDHICEISAHLCGQPCHLSGKGGCLDRCSKAVNHIGEEHLCPAKSHECGEPCSLTGIRLSDGSLYSCPEICRIPSNNPHNEHHCENRSCPLPCQLCRRLCANPHHLHALDPNASHLCGQEHACTAVCVSPGICRIETAPQSIEATFTGRHETFQYTKYSQVSKRLHCAIIILAGQLAHNGKHVHSIEKNMFHFCETRCDNCGYFCTLPLGHTQQEHETSHGSMSRTKWAVDGPEGTIVEVNGHKFGSSDDGAPMLCSMLCRNMGRHAHIEFCRSASGQPCTGTDLQHINTRMLPSPDRAKDYISHSLYWRRTGFRDPYSQEDRTNFSKCDSMCPGPEHQVDANGAAQPSYCNLTLFHPALPAGQAPPGGVGYVSGDGHHFSCRNPVQMQQAFHVIFAIDRSGSMGLTDRRPLRDTPVTAGIAGRHDNRLGAVYSSLHAFWAARHAALTAGTGAATNRRDAYSVILFDHTLYHSVMNDFTGTPDELLNQVMPYGAGGGTNFTSALNDAQTVMERNWSTERMPVLIFLSDGECTVSDVTIRDLCRRAIALGRPLSFHAVAFGPRNQTLVRMEQIATQVQRGAPADPMHPTVPSSYTEALDTIRLAETFLGIAESLRKPRGSLMRG